MNEWTNSKICDVLNLIFGGLLVISPWLFHLPSGSASENALIAGLIIAVISIAALAALAIWEEWLNLIVGLWVIVSPWVLGFAQGTAMQVHVVIGVLVAVLAAIELWILYQRPPRQMATR